MPPADVQRGSVAAEDDAGDPAVAADQPCGAQVEWADPVQGRRHTAGLAAQGGQVGGQGDLRGGPAVVRGVAGGEPVANDLTQPVGAALRRRTAVVGGRGRAGVDRLHQRGPGVGVQQPVQHDHPVQGRGAPQPAPLVRRGGVIIGAVGVHDMPQVGQDPAEPGRVQDGGGFEQDRLGGGHRVDPYPFCATGQHRYVGDGQRAGGVGRRGTGQLRQDGGDGGLLAGVRPAHPESVGQPRLGGQHAVGRRIAANVEDRETPAELR